VTFTLHHGLPDHLRDAAVDLYWQAFGSKLGRVMGPDGSARAFIGRVLRGNHAITALDDQGALLGMAGFKTYEGSFAGGEVADVRAVYGAIGAAWRLPLLWMLSDDAPSEHFLLDGICVAQAARGLGVGTALMQAIETEGRGRGYAAVRLDVVDGNIRAKELYHRLGYRVEKVQDIGLLRFVYGFRSTTTMVKPL
jgi:ribosomal protein S18 acetylase RimI-like enzyme